MYDDKKLNSADHKLNAMAAPSAAASYHPRVDSEAAQHLTSFCVTTCQLLARCWQQRSLTTKEVRSDDIIAWCAVRCEADAPQRDWSRCSVAGGQFTYYCLCKCQSALASSRKLGLRGTFQRAAASLRLVATADVSPDVFAAATGLICVICCV